MGWFPCASCCGGSSGPDCLISAGWETIVKSSLLSTDITGWTITSGTWDGKQSWESGTVADYLETSSSNAVISCDTKQSLPLNDRIRTYHWIKLSSGTDEAIVWMANHKLVFTGSSVSIYSPAGTLLTSRAEGLSYGTEAYVRICSWYDADTGLEYIGTGYDSGAEWTTLIAETVLDSDGTTAFGTGSVTGTVSFHHQDPTTTSATGRDGDFYHNTPRTDGSGDDCGTCMFGECTICPGNDVPRYLTADIDGLATPAYGKCGNCTNLNASYIIDMLGYSSDECAHYSFATVSLCTAVAIPMPWDQADYSVEMDIEYVDLGSGNWKLKLTITEIRDDTPYVPGAPPPYPFPTAKAIYSKSYTDSDQCTDIDDDLTLESITYPAGSSYRGCINYDSLTVHVTASQ